MHGNRSHVSHRTSDDTLRLVLETYNEMQKSHQQSSTPLSKSKEDKEPSLMERLREGMEQFCKLHTPKKAEELMLQLLGVKKEKETITKKQPRKSSGRSEQQKTRPAKTDGTPAEADIDPKALFSQLFGGISTALAARPLDELASALIRQLNNPDTTERNQLYQRYLRREQEKAPIFLDIPRSDATSRDLYKFLASAGFAREQRLYGELLIHEDNEKGWDYLKQAAAQDEPRALFLMTEHYLEQYNDPHHEKKQECADRARKSLMRSAQLKYPPACELLAQAHWAETAGLNFPRNSSKAIALLDQSISLYTDSRVADQTAGEDLRHVCDSLRIVRTHMHNLSAGNIKLQDGFHPSYEALKIASYSCDNANGLRARLYFIRHRMEQQKHIHQIDCFNRTKLHCVPITIVNDPLLNWSGLCTPSYPNSNTHSYNISVNSAFYAPESTAKRYTQEWYKAFFYREMRINNTLAHELAHGYFLSRYPWIANFSTADARLTYEGHATQAACALIRSLYFEGSSKKLSSEQYAQRHTSKEYSEYFYWFHKACHSPSGIVFWKHLDDWERKANPKGSDPVNMPQVPDEGKKLWAPTCFGRAFYGYM